MFIPAPLLPGDRIAIISPSSPVKSEYIDGAERWIRSKGWQPVRMPHADGPAHGSYAADDEARLQDLLNAWSNPDIKAILCARGGYGAVRLLEKASEKLPDNISKWLIGFSDISAIHALLLHHRIASIHGPMAKHLTEHPDDAPSQMLEDILRGEKKLTISSPHPDSLSQPGHVEGRLVGGNLAVINGLFATPFDPIRNVRPEKAILLIEDISEKIYAVERMLYHLRLTGAFDSIAGMVIGQFTDYTSDRNFTRMEEMISAFLNNHDLRNLPVWMNAPRGHVDTNFPLVLGSRASLKVSSSGASLSMLL